MANSDREHFDSYRLQTRVKHAILEGYLPAYFHILKRWRQNLLFIDGFAGRGHYSSMRESFPGSPLRALKIVAENEGFTTQVQCVMIEKCPEFYADLKKAVGEFYEANSHIKEPIVALGGFSENIDNLLASVDEGQELAPTFLFVDPCGVDDVSLERIANILGRDYCEVFIFFNLDGIRRIAGLAAKKRFVSPTLINLYGSEAKAADVVRDYAQQDSAANREACLLDHYRSALREASGAEFAIPLRVENEHRQTTSHYLIHATKNDLAFKIMKDVMWRSGGGIECEGGTLALHQASRRNSNPLFRPDIDALDEEILRELEGGPRPVRLFKDEWPRRPHDMVAPALYRERLLALESTGKLIVLDDDGRTLCPVGSRRRIKGQPTLAERLFVSLA